MAVLCGLQPQPRALIDKAELLSLPLVAHCENVEDALRLAEGYASADESAAVSAARSRHLRVI
jgi:hypothetical protein